MEKEINKADIIARISEKTPFWGHDLVAKVVNLLLTQMVGTIAKGNRIEVRGFGTFNIHSFPERVGRNPKTGESVLVPEKRNVRFKPGRYLKVQVDSAK